MTTAYAHRVWSPIGAMELKSSYHRNMTKAVLLILLLFAMAIGGVVLWRLLFVNEVQRVWVDYVRTIDAVQLGLPTSIIQKPVQVKVDLERTVPVFAIPEAAPDEEVIDNYVVVPPEDYARLAPNGNFDPDALSGLTVNIVADPGIFPAPGVFVAYEESPRIVTLPAPKYPEIARKAEIEGTVYVEVLIDTRGKVRDARVLKGTGANVGFEDAALEAALRGEWRPAMQNNQPVAVWVSYPVQFRLK